MKIEKIKEKIVEAKYPNALKETKYWIIGHDKFGLADVLLAIEKSNEEYPTAIGSYHGIFLIGKNLLSSGVFWNLKDNNLENQSEEFINFLYNLLYEK